MPDGGSGEEYVLRPPGGPFRIDYERDLNAQQRAVVLAGGGPILVIAGAGSGKTRTLVYRMARLVEEGVPAGAILLLTFTNKAAREMTRRAEALMGGAVPVVGGTFHHAGHLALRRFYAAAGLPRDFTIADREDASELIGGIGQELYGKRLERFPKGEVLLDIVSMAANTETSLEEVVATRRPEQLGLEKEIEEVARKYAERKRRLGVVDFDDLLVLWRQVLERDAEAREETQRRFAHVLVDEYQDTNLVQGRIADLVAGAHRNLMVVGDDAQSIYSFRGANFQNIIGFTDRYPDAKLYRLEINYRSTPEILSLANASIAHNRLQFAKTLEAQIAPGAKPKLVPLTRAEEQADYVAQRIRELEDEGLPLDEIAVLYRSHYLALDLQMELARRGIPFEVRSGLRFTEMAHVKDATAYLRVAVNPKDEIAWKRILQLLPRVGRATAGRIWAAVEASKDPIGDLLAGRLPAPRAVRDSVGKLADTVRAVRNQPDNPSAQLDAVLAWGYQEHVEDTWDNASSRLQDLRTLATWAGRFGSTAGFLSELALMSDAAETAGAADDGPPERKVVLSTVHQAKGLEWEAVFVIWLADGRFPDQRAVGEGGEEEERRLFYVATTRARRHLELCFPMFGREGQFAGVRLKVSRFLEELPAELVTAVAVRRGGWGQGRAREPHPDDDDRWMDGDE